MAAVALNQAQIDILNMLQWVKSPESLPDLKQVISDFFAKKVKEEMDAMWASGQMIQEKFDAIIVATEREIDLKAAGVYIIKVKGKTLKFSVK